MAGKGHGIDPGRFPKRPIDRMLSPLRRFIAIEAASGVLLLAMTVVALVLANSGAAADYRAFVETRVFVGVGAAALDYPLWYWVNDALMALFFFVVGLELKREIVHGHLRNPRNAMLPISAAFGGAAVPALLFLFVLGDGEGAGAWAVPMATDIAFVVGALALFGRKIPHGLRIFALTLAIVDDLMAVCVIAFVYTEGLDVAWLLGAAGALAVVLAMRYTGVRSIGAYVIVGAVLWLMTLKSGLHPTIAGVILGLLTPARAWLESSHAEDAVAGGRLAEASLAAKEATAPLERLEHGLHPWVAFSILPLFVFVNAGVSLGEASATEGVGLAIALGLLLGKPVGIGLFAWLSTVTLGARLPTGVTWPMLLACGVLCGVGFTMSLFIASLGLQGQLLESAKAGILYGSGASLFLGLGLLWLTVRRRAPDADECDEVDDAEALAGQAS